MKERSTGMTSKAKRILAVIVSAVIAIALGITCALCLNTDKRKSVVDVEDGEGVTTSTRHNNLTGRQLVDGIKNYTVKAGDTIDYSYNGGFYYLTLPANAKLTLEAWGAQGGGVGNDNGGKGGHVAITITTAYEVDISICIGGKGTNSQGSIDGSTDYSYAGGYNGGGNGSGRAGPGGGGATHIVHNNANKLLKNTYSGNMVLVAGGGGGGNNTSYTQRYASGGSYGQGASGCHNRHNGSYLNDEGGGGGGFYGGGVYHADDSKNGYAGQNWTNGGPWGWTSSGVVNQYGVRAGHGYARITITSCNAYPLPKIDGGVVINDTTPETRGTGKTIDVVASTIAKDPEGTAVAFTDNNSTNYDLFTTTPTLYLDAAGTVSASKYVAWAKNGNNVRITEIKRFPRAGIDGQANGVLTLYVRVRDTFGRNTKRGVSLVPFKVKVTDTAATKRTGVALSSNNANLPTTQVYLGNSAAGAQHETSSPTNVYNPNGGGRYTAQISKPLLLYSAGTNTDDQIKVTIKASDFLTGVNTTYDRAVIAINDVSKINKNDPTRIFKVIEYDNDNNSQASHKVTAYNAGGTQIANAFDQITIVGMRTASAYQVLPVTVFVMEKTDNVNRQLPSPHTVSFTVEIAFRVDNTRPTVKPNVTPVVELNSLVDTPINLNDYFADADNSAISDSTHRITGVVVPDYEFLQLDKHGKVTSLVNSSGKSYFNATSLSALPSKSVLAGALTTGVMSNTPTGFESWYISTTPTEFSYVKYSFSGSRLVLTGQRATHSMYDPARSGYASIKNGSTDADISASNCTAASKIENAGHFYILIHLQDLFDTDDTGIWLPLGIIVNNANPTDLSTERGQVGATVMPTANGNIGDAPFYFSPMGVTVDHVTTAIGFRVDASGNKVEDLKPLAADPDNYYTTNMLGGSDLKLNELLTVYATNPGSDIATTVQSSVAQNSGGQYFSVATEKIYIDPDYIGGRFSLDAFDRESLTIDGVTRSYVVVTGLKITLNNWTHNRYLYATVPIQDKAGESVNVKLAIYVGNNTPTALDGTKTGEKVATVSYTNNGKTISSSYDRTTATVTYNIPVRTSVIVTPYDILTDLNMTKAGISYPDEGFTLNGLSGSLSGNTSTTGGTFTVGGTSGLTIDGIANSHNVKEVGGVKSGIDYSTPTYTQKIKDTLTAIQRPLAFSDSIAENNNFGLTMPIATANIDRLYFARENDSSALDGFNFNPYASGGKFATPAIANDSYVKLAWGNKIDFGGGPDDAFNLDFLVITADQRTPAGVSTELTVTVRDRMGAGVSGVNSGITQIKIKINVINSTPYLKDPDVVYTLRTKVVEGTQVHPTVLELMATGENGILEDNEDGDDFVMFYTAGYAPSVHDGNGNAKDDDGNSYLGKYLSVTITQRVLTITALSSTQNITSGLYLTFYATDGRSTAREDQSTLTVQVLVENSSPYVNNGAGGIDTVDMGFGEINMWNVTSFTDSDTTLTRFITSSAKVSDYLLNGTVATTAGGSNTVARASTVDQVKSVVLDNDALQGSVLLPTYLTGADRTYLNVPEDKLTDYSEYKNYIPYASTVAPSKDNEIAAGVLIDFVNRSGNSLANKNVYFDTYVSDFDIIYYVDLGSGLTAYTASELRDASSTVVATHHDKFFDEHGRFIVTDWVLYVKPKLAFEASTYFKMSLNVRDNAEFGGDTAGLDTAIAGNADNVDESTGTGLVSVNGLKVIDCFMFVKGTGITTLDYYDRFDGYYAVTDGNGSGVSYVSTYDGDPSTTYAASVKPIYVDGSGKLVNVKPSGTAGTDYTEVKTNVAAGASDGTRAGTHSGTEYGSFNVADLDKLPDGSPLEQAFRYSHTLEVSGDKTVATYLPMSYLALNKKLVNISDKTGEVGKVEYFTDRYIAYDILTNGTNGYDRNNISAISSAITIRDGNGGEWGGDSGNSLNSNPYVTVSTFDYYGQSSSSRDPAYTNSKYLNKNLAVTTVGENDAALDYYKDGTNHVNYVGNGHMMYLAEQQNNIQEHLFGLTFTKNKRRSSVSGLTVSIEVASCMIPSAGTGTVTNYQPEDKDMFTATVTLGLNIGNSQITLNTGNKVDGVDQYYVDMHFATGDRAKDLALVRSGSTGTTADATVIYNDADYDGATGGDEGFFLTDSTLRLSSWSSGSDEYNRPKTLSNAGLAAPAQFTYTDSSEAAQVSMRRYYGANNASAYNGIGPSYHPNGGIYGTFDNDNNLIEGYSRYFSVGYADNGRRMIITPHAKTLITPEAVEGNRADFYRARGLVVVEGDNGNISAYYPLKVLVYDSCGDGTDSCSYVSLEVRVYIVDSAPMLSTRLDPTNSNNKDDLNRTVKISLAVGSSYNLNLAEIITDNDLLSNADGSWMWKSDYNKLDKNDPEQQFKRETGDYLMTPFDSTWKQTNNSELIGGFAKLYDYKATDTAQPDVIMYMEYVGNKIVAGTTDPSNNIIKITANKRTINDGVAVKKFTFDLTFRDSYYTNVKNDISGVVEKVHNSTGVLTIEVTITNKAPNVLSSSESTVVNNITMRVGDSFTIMTTPFDYFNGVHSNSETSARASTSYRTYIGTDSSAVGDSKLFRNPATDSFDGRYSQYIYTGLTSDKLYASDDLAEEDIRYVRNWTDFDTSKITGPIHLGYSAIADDDTPWALRMRTPTYSKSYFSATPHDRMSIEGTKGTKRAIDFEITAVSACRNQPISVVIEDDEGAYVEYTFYVTVVSTPPRAITSADKLHPLGAGLEFGADNSHDKGMFQAYMKAADGTANTVSSVLLNNNKTVKAYSTLTVNIDEVAYDPDNSDNNDISLYSGLEVPLFAINNIGLELGDGDTSYSNSKFSIVPTSDNKSFTITCNYYDNDSNVDNLTFYVRDVGDDRYENAREINISITTLYSSLSNKHAADKTSMLTPGNYKITGADTVYVKSHDLFLGYGDSAGADGVGKLSTYNFLKYQGMPEVSVDQTAESGAYIIDPDVALNGDMLNYDVRVYAFMNNTAEDEFSALTLANASGYFNIQRSTTDANANYFRLRSENSAINSEFSRKYLIGGRTALGSSYNSYVNRDLLQYVNRYFEFSIGDDGVSLELRPVTANINNDILLYVEVEKKVGSVKVYPNDKVTALTAGSLFYVKVKDSAPIANASMEARSFTGSAVKAVDGQIPEVEGVNVVTFKIFDMKDPLASLFTDSDEGDDVSVDLFRTEADYRAALGEYYDVCKAVGISVDRAFDITVSGKTLKIKINRRIDMIDKTTGRYMDSVTIPVNIVGKDIEGQKSASGSTGKTTVTLYITVKNSPVTVDLADLAKRNLDVDVDPATHVGYVISETEKPYVFDLNVRTSKAVGAQTISVIRWLDDPDFTKVSSDTESFRLVANNDSNKELYLLDKELTVLDDEDPSKKIATLVPVFGADKLHFTGFTVTPLSDERGHSGTAYMRVIDRAGNEDLLDAGVTFKMTVTIANSAPVVIEGDENKNQIDVVGSNSSTLSPISINIKDYVTDPNPTDLPNMIGKTDTYIRIVDWRSEEPEEIFSTATEGDFSRIFDMTVSDDHQSLSITPLRGFYGSQKLTITVADGEYTEDETDMVSFTINVGVRFDFADIGDLNEISAIRGMVEIVSIDTLVKPLENNVTKPASANGISLLADDGETGTFNPAAGYVVTNLTVPNSYSRYIDIIRPDEENKDWRFKPKRETTSGAITLEVEFKLGTEANEPSAKAYKKNFNVTIAENPKPKLIEAFKNGYTFYSSGDVLTLNAEGAVLLSPSILFTDNVGDIVKFEGASSEAPSLVTVDVLADDTLQIRFLASGTAEISITVSDTTDESVTYKFKVSNHDLPEPTFWQRIKISFETNKLMWIIIAAAVLLAIIILIIVIIAVKHRKRKREELEAMLMSEMELEEQMMRLAAGSGVTQYNSYGYLPPTMGVQQDPSMLLGSGTETGANPNVLNLNPGQTANPNQGSGNTGSSPDGDM